ncbi:hypothetical protein [Rouxiella sp. WC2420]|uniref:Phage protein n=1 Tax=Rouxiella sp. WC2420 TaxID=3234145 RepID=A0AB39VKI1_9GAMM
MTIQTFKGVQNQELVLKSDYDAVAKIAGTAEILAELIKIMKADYDKLAAECAPYKKFFEHAWSFAIEACDFDGASIQDLSIELGLVKSEIYDSDKHSDLVNDASLFENGDDVYFPVKTPVTDSAIAELKAQQLSEFRIWAKNSGLGLAFAAIEQFSANRRAGVK